MSPPPPPTNTPGQSHRLRAQQVEPEPVPRGPPELGVGHGGSVRSDPPPPTEPLTRQCWAAHLFSPGVAALISAEPTSASSQAPCQPPWSLTSYPERRASIGLGHPPLGWEGSLVPTVEQKAAHPWAGSPPPHHHHQPTSQPGSTPTRPAGPPAPGSLPFPPRPLGLHRPLPTNPTSPRAPLPSRGCKGNSTPLVPGAATGRAPH